MLFTLQGKRINVKVNDTVQWGSEIIEIILKSVLLQNSSDRNYIDYVERGWSLLGIRLSKFAGDKFAGAESAWYSTGRWIDREVCDSCDHQNAGLCEVQYRGSDNY